MRIVILHYDYEAFEPWMLNRYPLAGATSYEERLQVRYRTLFGVADSYSAALSELGHEPTDFFVNSQALQSRWAVENGVRHGLGMRHRLRECFRHAKRDRKVSTSRRLRGIVSPIFAKGLSKRDMDEILLAQVEQAHPDVVFIRCMHLIDDPLFTELRKPDRVIVGQIASPIPDHSLNQEYDLVLSSLPNLVETFRNAGLRSEYLPLGFEPSFLQRLPPSAPEDPHFEVSFVGSLGVEHRDRISLLEWVSGNVPLHIWTHSSSGLRRTSPLWDLIRGEAFGIDGYRIMRSSDVSLNKHIDLAGDYANNMRLFEATGMGSALVTDRQTNLDAYFVEGAEILAYDDPEECVDAVLKLRSDADLRRQIAEAGRNRTLSEHTNKQRMETFVETIKQEYPTLGLR